MSSTPEGKNWVIKALHPSDPLTTIRGLPDESSGPSVVLSYYNVFRLSAPIGQTSGSWGFDLTIMPNLLVPLYYVKVDGSGAPTAAGNYLNMSFAPPGVTTPTYNQVLTQFQALGLEAHRLIACGVTAYQDGPALANQGTITAAQWEVARQKYHDKSFNALAPATISTTRIALYQGNDFANYDFSQHMPNAYFAESKEGCYLPLRLTRTSQKWTTDADLEFFGDTALPHVNGNLHLPLVTGGLTRHAAPFPDLTCAYANDVLLDPNYGGTWGDLVYAPLNGTWGGISCRNLSYQTSFAFYIRQVIEARVTPTSLLAPQVQMSPPYDPTAIATYFRINRELKDAYPADFNDLGKIWDVIKTAAKTILPFLSAAPGPAGLVGQGGTMLMSALDKFSQKASQASGSKRRGRDKPPAAAVERAQKAEVAREVLQSAPSTRKAIAKMQAAQPKNLPKRPPRRPRRRMQQQPM